MIPQKYEHKKAECWEEASRRYDLSLMNGTIHAAFNFAFDRAYSLGKQETKQEIKQETDADTVIQGWVVRGNNGKLYICSDKPKRYNKGLRCVMGCTFSPLSSDLFPDLTWNSEPEEVEIIIKRKKK